MKIDLKISDANVEITMVRCFELQPEIDDEEIAEIFKSYGVVKSWPKRRQTRGQDSLCTTEYEEYSYKKLLKFRIWC